MIGPVGNGPDVKALNSKNAIEDEVGCKVVVFGVIYGGMGS